MRVHPNPALATPGMPALMPEMMGIHLLLRNLFLLERCGSRQKGWSPQGIALVQVAPFQRGCRYEILPAYTQDSVMLARVPARLLIGISVAG